MKISAVVRALVAAKATPEMILAAVEAAEAEAFIALEEGKEKARARWRRWKANQPETNVGKRLQPLANGSREGVTRVEDNLQTKILAGKEEKKDSAPAARADLDAFRSELSPILDPERIEALIAVRRKKGATFTVHAARILAKSLRACPSPSEAADEMVLRNWTGIKPEWLERSGTGSTAPPRKTTSASIWTSEAKASGYFDEPTDQAPGRLGESHPAGHHRGPVQTLDLAVSPDRAGH